MTNCYAKYQGEMLNEQLPTEVYGKGYTFRYIKILDENHTNRFYRYEYVLADRQGWELYKWTYNPTQGELWDKCKELELVKKEA